VLRLLARREIKARYKDSALGLVWSLFRPLTQLLIYYVVIGEFLGAARSIPEFAIFVFSGIAAYSLFSEIVSTATSSIVGNSGLVKKIYIPRELFPLASVLSALFNFAIQLGVLVIAIFALRQWPQLQTLYLLPLGFLLLLTFALGLGLLLSALNVQFRDVQHLVEVMVLVLFWASPIVYSYKFVVDALGGSWLEQLYLANPITLGIMAFQRALWSAGADEPWPADLELRIVIALAVSLLLVVVSQRVFARLEGNFAQEL
jgi:ABC-2 type transport system permease protein